MANEININGIIIDDINTTVAALEQGFKDIYGQEINLEQSTPDGQMINIFAQAKQDVLNLAVQIYNSFNAETVIGRAQDNLYKLVGIYRKSSRFSFVQVNVTTSQPVTLQGLDEDIENINGIGYTVADSNGNNFILSNSVSITSAGTFLLEFRAQDVGAVQVIPNTITNMVTVIGGVTGVNNPTVQYLLGNAEETDAEFRIRFNKSRSISSKGFEDSLRAVLLNLNLVTDAEVYQNRGSTVDEDGTNPHTVWTIVEGGSNDDIAQAIYANVTDGAGMRGETVEYITKSNGLIETIRFDRAVNQDLYVQATLKNLTTGSIDVDTLKADMASDLTYGIYKPADSASVTCYLANKGSGVYIPYDVAVSKDGSTWEDYIRPDSKQNKFTLSAENITLNVVV